MVEVLSSHYLGPKKSIAIVRIAERILVLGISNESINLITELDESEAADLDVESLGLGSPAATASRSQAAARSAAAEYVKSGLPQAPAPVSSRPLSQPAKAPASPAPARTASRSPAFDAAAFFGEPSLKSSDRAPGPSSAFADLLQAEANRTRPAPSPTVASATGANGAVRSQIRSRLEGLKQL